jgi:hypothetical protein
MLMVMILWLLLMMKTDDDVQDGDVEDDNVENDDD